MSSAEIAAIIGLLTAAGAGIGAFFRAIYIAVKDLASAHRDQTKTIAEGNGETLVALAGVRQEIAVLSAKVETVMALGTSNHRPSPISPPDEDELSDRRAPTPNRTGTHR